MAAAIPLYEEFLHHAPNDVPAHIGLAQAYLASGNLEKGFDELEWHLGSPQEDTQTLRNLLDSGRPLTGLKVLIRAEWGLGDSMQFIRYAELLKLRGATIFVELQPQLAPLFRMLHYLDKIILPTDSLEPFHLQIPMLSLAKAFRTNLHTIPQNIPYLDVDIHLVKHWQTHCVSTDIMRIGICWHGNTIHGHEKFIPLDELIAAVDLPGISLFSLQRNHGLDALTPTVRQKIRLLPEDADTISGSFMDTAAIIYQLDLVISVDTAIAHLAGALGKKIWLVVPYNADWRWLQNSALSPWYPTMRIFRQKNVGSWNNVVSELNTELLKLIEKG